MNQESNSVLFSLLRSAICGNRITETEKNILSEDLIKEVCTVARKHDLTHLIAYALESNMYTIQSKHLGNEIIKSVYRYEQLEYDFSKLCETLETYKKPFIPLKGSVIRKLYPEPWMRTSCDIDILVKREDVEKIADYLVENCNYTCNGKTFHDISLFSPNKVHIELHFTLIEDGIANEAAEVLEEVWNSASPKSGYLYWHEMTDELFYFYHIAHMVKHFITGGCGIKPFIDLWLLDNTDLSVSTRRNKLLEKGGLLKFAKTVQNLSKVWFSDAPADEISNKMQAFILQGGVYGSAENRVVLQQKKQGGKIGYILSRMFIPYTKLKSYYPILEKHKWLTPIMQIRRWGLLSHSRVASLAKNELAANTRVGKDSTENMKTFMEDIGIK